VVVVPQIGLGIAVCLRLGVTDFIDEVQHVAESPSKSIDEEDEAAFIEPSDVGRTRVIKIAARTL
jgi:hypothetical protein